MLFRSSSTITKTLDLKVMPHEVACLSCSILGLFTFKHNFSFDHVTGPSLFDGIENGSCNTVLNAFWFLVSVFISLSLSLSLSLSRTEIFRTHVIVPQWCLFDW